MMHPIRIAIAAGALLLLAAGSPARAAGWSALSCTYVENSPAPSWPGGTAGGANAYGGTGVANGFAQNPDVNGNEANGGGSWTVTRHYTRDTGNDNQDVVISLSVLAGANATGAAMGNESYGHSQSTSRGDAGLWPDLRGGSALEKTNDAAYPAGPQHPADQTDNTDNDSASDRTKTLTSTGDVSGSFSVSVQAMALHMGASGDATSDAWITFADP